MRKRLLATVALGASLSLAPLMAGSASAAENHGTVSAHAASDAGTLDELCGEGYHVKWDYLHGLLCIAD
ncbi:hypothetical protein [Streptomyces sp. NPDC088725]|uniref:hypothetical protein n=1 Tax=Streptomyces sp. NPDC088725 TaxID=3365873 RepID=UPI00382E856E